MGRAGAGRADSSCAPERSAVGGAPALASVSAASAADDEPRNSATDSPARRRRIRRGADEHSCSAHRWTSYPLGEAAWWRRGDEGACSRLECHLAEKSVDVDDDDGRHTGRWPRMALPGRDAVGTVSRSCSLRLPITVSW